MSQNSATNTEQRQVVSNYYFQIHPKSIISKESNESGNTSLSFTVSKGKQLFDHTQPVSLQWNHSLSAEIINQRLIFVVLNYDPQKYEEFAFRICRPESLEQDHLAEYLIDCNNFIDHFIKTRNGAFEITMNCQDKYVVEAQLFVEKNRISLEKMVKSVLIQKQSVSNSKIQVQRIEQRSEEAKSKYLKAPKQNRFKRTPSPMRRQIKDIIMRRKSPTRKTPHSHLQNQQITPEKPSEPEQKPQQIQIKPQENDIIDSNKNEEILPEQTVQSGQQQLKKVRFKGKLSDKQKVSEQFVIQKTQSAIQVVEENQPAPLKPSVTAIVFFLFLFISAGLWNFFSGSKKKSKAVKTTKQMKTGDSKEEKPKPAKSKNAKPKAAKSKK